MKIWAIGFAANAQWIIVDTIWYGGNNLSIQIFITLVGALTSLLFFYIFGAVWDDTSKRRALGGFRHEEPDNEVDSENVEVGGNSPSVPGEDEAPIPGEPPAPGVPGVKNNAG